MKPGDIVMLKSGGPDMVILAEEHGQWKCLYYFEADGAVKAGMFPEFVLTKRAPAKATPKRRAR